MGNAVITKGSTITIGVGTYDIKAVVIEDFDINVGENAVENIVASDGTIYPIVAEQGQSDMECKVIITDDAVEDILTSIYGTGTSTLTGGGTGVEWDLRDAGTTTNNIAITSPQTSSSVWMKFVGVNGKGLVFRPTFRLNRGYEATVKFVVDYWIAQRQTT